MQLSEYSHYFFDMDGVLVDSNQMKISAARATAESYSLESADQFAKHFQENFGRTRSEHFEYFYFKHLEQLGYEFQVVSDLISAYGEIVRREYEKCGLCDGAQELIAEINVPKFVVTGGSQDEAKSMLFNRGLSTHFSEILGAPTRKVDNVRSLIRAYGVDPSSAVFIGDSRHDFEVAVSCDLHFTLVTKYINHDPADLIADVLKEKGRVVFSLSELLLN